MLLVVSLRNPAASIIGTQFPDGDLLPCIYGWQFLATQPSASIQKGKKDTGGTLHTDKTLGREGQKITTLGSNSNPHAQENANTHENAD